VAISHDNGTWTFAFADMLGRPSSSAVLNNMISIADTINTSIEELLRGEHLAGRSWCGRVGATAVVERSFSVPRVVGSTTG
jgi:hypothetical protein